MRTRSGFARLLLLAALIGVAAASIALLASAGRSRRACTRCDGCQFYRAYLANKEHFDQPAARVPTTDTRGARGRP